MLARQARSCLVGPWRGNCFSTSKRLGSRDTDFAKLCTVLKARKAAETQASLFAHRDWCVGPSWTRVRTQENSAFVTGE